MYERIPHDEDWLHERVTRRRTRVLAEAGVPKFQGHPESWVHFDITPENGEQNGHTIKPLRPQLTVMKCL